MTQAVSSQARKTVEWTATPKQMRFLERTEFEVLYGGAKFGGKTDVLLTWAIGRRAKYAHSRGLFIRREITELTKQGAAWDRIQEILGESVKYNQTEHTVTFPNGSVQEFGHCHDENDKFHYQGAQYDDLCVLRGTPVLMGDGRWKPIEDISVGEYVATLEGPRAITRTWAMGVQPVAEIRTLDGTVTVSASHRIMLANGVWASPNELLSRQSLPSGIHESVSLPKFQLSTKPLSFQPLGLRLTRVPAGQGVGDRADQQSFVWSANDRTGYVESDDGHQVESQPVMWSGQIMQLSRVPRLGGWADDAKHGVLPDLAPQDSPNGYLGDLCSCDVLAQSVLVSGLDSTQQLDGVEGQSPGNQHWDDQGNTLEHNQRYYAHPYTREKRVRVEDVRPVVACIVRAGVGEVFDLTVALASHFIVDTGIIAQNCFDQLEQFTETQYAYIKGACRTPLDNPPVSAEGTVIQPRVRCSANPGDVGHVWVKSYFIDVCASEQVYVHTSVVDTPDGGKMSIARERVFIPASVFDSVRAGVVDQSYVATLDSMPEPYRSAYLYGMWDVFIGQAFLDFKPMVEGQPYHVIPYRVLPPTWRRIASHDWGYDAPMYTIWWALDPSGGAIVYRELWARNWAPEEIATQNLLAQGGETISQTYADPSIWAEGRAKLTDEQVTTLKEKGLYQLSIADQYAKSGWHVQPANNDRLAGKMSIHRLLKERPDGVPWLRIMDSCPRLIATMGQIQLNPKRTEDVVTDYPADAVMRDEPYDALRYGAMSMTSLTTMPHESVVSKSYTGGMW